MVNKTLIKITWKTGVDQKLPKILVFDGNGLETLILFEFQVIYEHQNLKG